MKVKMRPKYETLNPIPVMGKHAFVAFAKKWVDLVDRKGYIRLPDSIKSKKYSGSYNGEGSLVYDGLDIAKLAGTCDNPFHIRSPSERAWEYSFEIKKTTISPKSHPYISQFSIDVLTEFELSNNIAFIRLRFANKNDTQKLEEILTKTERMIYERSALVYRGLFGGYSL